MSQRILVTFVNTLVSCIHSVYDVASEKIKLGPLHSDRVLWFMRYTHTYSGRMTFLFRSGHRLFCLGFVASTSFFRQILEQQLLQIRPWSFLHRPFQSSIHYVLSVGLPLNFSEILSMPLNYITIIK